MPDCVLFTLGISNCSPDDEKLGPFQMKLHIGLQVAEHKTCSLSYSRIVWDVEFGIKRTFSGLSEKLYA